MTETPALSSLVSGEGAGVCDVCGRTDCRTQRPLHRADYPLLPGGGDPMADQPYVTATERIIDEQLGRVVYSPGDRVPMADAEKYGLVKPATPVEGGPEPAKAKRGRRTRHKPGPDETTARTPGEDR